MRLQKLLAPIDDFKLQGDDCDITGLTTDSRTVKPGNLFIAVPGTQQDGRAFIGDALARGASAVMVPKDGTQGSRLGTRKVYPEPQTPKPKSLIIASDIRAAVATLAARFYPQQPKRIAAVTGTSGKTSTAQFARQIWQANGHASASVGTLGLVTATDSHYGSLTTPDAITLHKILDECAKQGITHLSMEASSHGIDLHRLDHVRFQVAAFTNLSRDHLDYHPDMASYLAAKLRLFTDLLPDSHTAVLNADVPEFDELAKACRDHRHSILSYGRNGKELKLKDFSLEANGQRIRFNAMGKDFDILLSVVGEYQVWNALCALGMAVGSGEDVAKSAAALEKVSGAPGRLQYVGTTIKGGLVFVDYAHKPGALENVLTAMRAHVAQHPGAKLHVVFGCGGNRDKGKRPQMGSIAQRLADHVIVTDDNPRKEIPAEIRREVLAGCAPSPNLREIGDRAEAIHTAIAGLNKDDVLVIAGKGHEKGQIVGDKVLPFDDADAAKQALVRETV